MLNPNNSKSLSVLGSVCKVDGGSVEIILQSEADTASPRATVGHYVLVDCQGLALIGQISSLVSHRSKEATELIAVVELLATYDADQGQLWPGVVSSPRLSSICTEADPELIQRLIEGRFSAKEEQQAISLDLAELSEAHDVSVSISPEKLFGRHCAVVGSSGGGKSWTIARLLEQTARFNSKVILLDATGEFYPLEGPIMHCHIGKEQAPIPNSKEVAVPFYHLTETDLFAIFKPTGESQGPKLRAAMKSLKLARYAPHIAVQGVIMKADRQKLEFEKEYAKFYDKIERPYADFDIVKLSRQIENECVNFQRSAVETNIWGGINGSDISNCMPMVNRINDIISSKSLNPLFDPGETPSIFKEINTFLELPGTSILRISLQYLSFEHTTREIVANAIGRHLLGLARRGLFREQPVVVVVDEAHQFLNADLLALSSLYKLDSFPLIAKEGRKYALTVCLATQRPRDIPEGVLSQVGTMFVHRLINHHDRDVVERASAGLDATAAASIPNLAPGEAVLLGVDFPIPLFLRVKPPNKKPDSRGPNYQKHWK